jgi:hypothetical protein
VNARTASVLVRIVEQQVGLSHDSLRLRPHQPRRGGFHGLGPLGFIAQDQDGLAERRSLLLYAARIGDEDVSPPHQVHKGNVVQRRDQKNVVQVGEPAVDRVEHVGIAMHRVHDLHVVPPGQLGKGGANALKTTAEALAPVCGDHNQFLRRIQLGPVRGRQLPLLQPIFHVQNRIDPRVAGDMDAGAVHPLLLQVAGGAWGGGKVQVGHARRQDAVHFLGKGPPGIPGAQAGFHVGYGHPAVECRQRSTQGGGGIPLHQHHVRHLAFHDRLERSDHARGGL